MVKVNYRTLGQYNKENPRGLSSHPYACSRLAYKQQTNKIVDIIRIKYEIEIFKKFLYLKPYIGFKIRFHR